MVKINTFSMAVSITYCLFHFQTKICFFSYFSYGQCLALEKNVYCLRIFLSTDPMELEYPKNMKELAEWNLFFKFSEKFG